VQWRGRRPSSWVEWIISSITRERRSPDRPYRLRISTVSIAALGGGGSSAAYATAKAGLAGLTRELARALAPEARVNGIAPSFVNSSWECTFDDIDAAARATVPLARVGEPADYAEVIVYLCAGASYITGEVIPVTGGARI